MVRGAVFPTSRRQRPPRSRMPHQTPYGRDSLRATVYRMTARTVRTMCPRCGAAARRGTPQSPTCSSRCSSGTSVLELRRRVWCPTSPAGRRHCPGLMTPVVSIAKWKCAESSDVRPLESSTYLIAGAALVVVCLAQAVTSATNAQNTTRLPVAQYRRLLHRCLTGRSSARCPVRTARRSYGLVSACILPAQRV